LNGIHDMGGMQDFGPIHPLSTEPVFHAPWEGRMYALWIAAPGDWSISADRFSKELIPPPDYLRMSYYEKIYVGLVDLLLQSKLVTAEEIASGTPGPPTGKPVKAVAASEVPAMVAKGASSRRQAVALPRFRAGQRVRARNINPVGHTRLPRYARAKTGTIERDHGIFVFSDSDAQGGGERPQHVYSVRFTARELWGNEAHAGDVVYVDLWDDHLDAA
jgi:nitrile hydratase subunit beta